MTILDEAKQLRSEISKLRPDQRRRYSKDLRRRILAWLERCHAEDMTDSDGSKLLGVKSHRFVMWREYEQKRAAAEAGETLPLVPVESPLLTSGFALTTPSGYRVIGLSISELVAILREVA